MALLALKVSAASKVAGQVQPGTVQVKSVKVTSQKTTALVLIPGGGFAGNVARPWVTKATDYQMLASDGGVLATATATFTLPASPIVGQYYGVKAGALAVPIVTTGSSAVIDADALGATTVQISQPGATVLFTLAPNGTDWLIVAVSSYAPLSAAPIPVPPVPVIS